MGRLRFPETYAGQVTLLGLVNAKHVADGAGSVLTAYLLQKGITLATDITTSTAANVQEASRALLERQGENYFQLRDIQIDPPVGHTRKGLQYLKQYYSPNVSELGNWGASVSNNRRINFPVDFVGRTTLWAAYKAKHDSFTTPVSPLAAFLTQNGFSMTADNSAVGTATTNNNSGIASHQQSENAREARDLLWNPVVQHLRDIGKFLMELFPTNQQKAGLWGFVIDESPRKPKLQKTTLILSSQKTIVGVVLGSTITNTGTVDIHLYKGKTTIGTPIIVGAAQKFGVPQKWSTITAVNPSTLVTATFTVLVNK